MKFKIKMLPDPGDKFIKKAVITKVDAHGVESVDQMVLEGERVEVDCNVGADESLRVRELPPPMKIEDMATKPATWEDVHEAIQAAKPPPPTGPEPKPSPHGPDPKAQVTHPTGPDSTSKGALTSKDVKEGSDASSDPKHPAKK